MDFDNADRSGIADLTIATSNQTHFVKSVHKHFCCYQIIEKVGQEVTIVKASEDYSAYASKQIEELEHMVELYDFPDTFKTHDIISNFTEIKSDSMYVKWLDDTRALLVLGSSSQGSQLQFWIRKTHQTI